MPTTEDFEMALAIAQDDYQQKDAREQVNRAGASWHPDEEAGEGAGAGHVVVPFLSTRYEIRPPRGEVSYLEEGGKEPALWEKILLLHYFNTADGSALSQEPISFKEIPEGKLYLPNFEKRAVAPLLGRFGRDPEEVWEPARSVGGRRSELGDFSVTIPAFPRVPVTLVFWKQDEEFPERLTILFDRTVVGYLPTEDIILSTQMLAFRLIGLAGKPQSA